MSNHRSRRGGLFARERERLKQQHNAPMAFGVLVVMLIVIIFLMLIVTDML